MVDSFEATCERGYYQGREGLEHWIYGLEQQDLWNECAKVEEVERRLQVNDALLLNLGDARRCAGVYLEDCVPLLKSEEGKMLSAIAQSYSSISDSVLAFRDKLNESNGKETCYNGSIQMKVNTNLREKQILLLREILDKEQQLVEKARYIIDRMIEQG